MEKTKYLIIGNGTAAVGAIEGIRKNDQDGKITVISKEERHCYCRPLISYYLEGMTTIEKMGYRSQDFYKTNKCDVIYGTATSLSSENKSVTLESGEVIEYEELLIATGSSPFVPPMDGLASVEKKTGFMTIDDALYLEENTNSDSRVLIIGAGLIGLKCAEGLAGRVKKITVCDLADKVLSSILDDSTAPIVKAHLEKNGIEFMLSDTAVSFDKNTAVMKSGAKVEFDMLVLAVGVRPNISIFKDAGGACGRAITIDEKMCTSIKDVYAAGDCTESMDITSESVKVMALMPNAYMQGRCAGENMSGSCEVFDNAIPMNSIGFFGMHIMSAGSYIGSSEFLTSENGVKEFFTKDGLLKGFILIDDVARAGIYTSIIRSRTPLDSIDFNALKITPDLYSFGNDYCRKKLGGVV